MRYPVFRVRDPLQAWYEGIFADHYDEALEVVAAQLANAKRDENGCVVTATVGGQDRVYRFNYCVLHRLAASSEQVVRHRCHNRRCINPDHLTIGDRRDNLQEERDRQANGVDWNMLQPVAILTP